MAAMKVFTVAVLTCALCAVDVASYYYGGAVGAMGPYAGGYGGGYMHNGHTTPMVITMDFLTGRERIVDPGTMTVMQGFAVTIQDLASTSGGGHGDWGQGPYGGYGNHGYGGGDEEVAQEAIIELRVADNFPTTDYVIVLTELAPTSQELDCPEGPLLTDPSRSNQGMDMGHYGGYGGLMGHGMGMGMGMGHGGYGGYHDPWGPHDTSMITTSGVLAEVTVNGGLNTFRIQDLAPYNNRKDLAGRGIALCPTVELRSGVPYCMAGSVLNCVTLGYSMEPIELEDM